MFSNTAKIQDKLIVFTRYPEPDCTKTRLISALGPQGAADLHRKMAARTLLHARQLLRQHPLSLEVHYSGGTTAHMQQWLGSDLKYRLQNHGDLGQRMQKSVEEAFSFGMQKAVIIGSDCAEVTSGLLMQAFDALDQNDIVLGPANDGGYYLIGLRKQVSVSVVPHLFSEINWGSDEVLEKTIHKAQQIGVSFSLLEPLDDIDCPEDLAIWERVQACPVSPLISVIIPTYNEFANIADTLASAKQGRAVELIVVDGGSNDNTIEIAKSCGAKVLTSPLQRAQQMNTGAAAAQGEVLLFLHADTHLPDEYDSFIRFVMEQDHNVGGAFELKLDAPERFLQFIQYTVNLRSRLLRLPYGDQAIFVRSSIFREIGGFSDIPIMEDVAIIKRIRKCGKIEIIPVAVTTSARRWYQHGLLRTTLINKAVFLAYFLGISPSKIARWYYGDRKS